MHALPKFQCGQRKMFRETHNWLMVASDGTAAVRTLRGVAMNIDADVTVAVRDAGRAAAWTVYDAYNPAFFRGGGLTVTRIGRYEPDRLDSYKMANAGVNKYWRRRDMGNVTLNTVMVVSGVESRRRPIHALGCFVYV